MTADHSSLFEDGFWITALHLVRWLWPAWWFWHWFVHRWVGHDCDEQPLTCRAEFLFHVPPWVWLDV